MSKYSTVFQVISTAVFFFLSLYLYQCSSFSELMAPIEGYSLTDVKKSNLTPESYTALFWMQRSSTVSYINLYNTDEETSGFETLDSTFAEEGNVVVPFRAMYLSIFGKVLEPLNETYSVWMGYYVGKISERDESYLRRSSVVVISFSGMFACLVCWKLVHTVSELIVNCVKQRESLVAERNRLLKGFTAEQIQSTINVTSISTAFVVLFLVVVPLFVLEVTSLNPVCCSSALVGLSVIFLVRGEADIARSKEEVNEFKTDKPIVIQGKLQFFPLKKAPSLTPFCLSAVIGVVAVLLDAGQFTNVLAVLAWIVTACVRRGNRRVLVKMVSGKDGPKNVGFSFYSDTMMMLTGMCCISAVIFGVLFCCTAPFWYGKQSWPVFAALFFKKAPQGNDISLSGAGESSERCFLDAPSNLCVRPIPNLWYLLEYMNVHLTSVVTLISANLGLSGSTRAVFDVIVILFRTPVFVILAMLIFVYRLTPVPLNFSTPEEYRSSCERQEKEEKAYETARRQQKSQAAAPPQGEKRSVNVVTAISVDEYILKQINLLGWLMVALSVSEVLFTPRQTPMAVASVFPGMLLVLSTVAATIVSRVLFPAVFESSVEDSMWCVDSPAAIATVHDLPCLFFLLTTVVLSSEAVLFLHMSERVRSTLSILIPLLGCSTIRRNGIESVGATVFVLLAYYLYSNYSHNSDNTTLSMERTTRFCLFSLCYLVIVYIRAFFRVVDLVIGKEEERHVPVEQQLGAYK